jgi:hypothetical protein
MRAPGAFGLLFLALSAPSLSRAAPPLPPPRLLEIATDPEHPTPFQVDDTRPTYSRERYERPSRWGQRRKESVALGVAAGRVFNSKISDGFYGRIGLDGLLRNTSDSTTTALRVEMLSIEAWSSPDGGGGSLPLLLQLGAASGPFVGALGVGWHWVLIDHVDSTGVGFLAPLAAANLGLDLGFLRVMADARASYRWQFTAHDRAQVLVGGIVEILP